MNRLKNIGETGLYDRSSLASRSHMRNKMYLMLTDPGFVYGLNICRIVNTRNTYLLKVDLENRSFKRRWSDDVDRRHVRIRPPYF